MGEELAVPPPGIRFNPTDDEVTLPPGFRFHPTDEELLSYYLKRKICGKTLHFDAISEIDLYKYEPWDLPEKSCLKTRDLEWYFFSPLDKKYGIGSRTNRATDLGYWKVTGKDREIRRKLKIVGLKKTLVFHQGRAPRGERTNWVMHEYRLEDGELTKAGIQRNSFVLCRVFQKSGPGPKTHEQYGAAFIEEEWDESVAPDSGLPLSIFSSAGPSLSESPKLLSSDHGEKQLAVYGSAMQDSCDQTKDIRIRRESSFLTPDFDGHESCNYFENGASFLEEQHADPKLLDVDGSYLESNDLWNSMDADYPTDETVDHLTSFDDPPAHSTPFEDGSFLEVNDLLNTMEPEASGFEMLDELLTYFDATDRNLHSVDLDSCSGPPERVDLIRDHSILAPDASSLVQKPETCDEDLTGKDAHANAESDVKNDNESCRDDGILSKLVGSIALPPAAFTESKYPMKGAKSIAAASSSSAASIHVTAATIHISSVTETGVSGKHSSSSSLKTRNMGFILSFGFLTLTDGDDRIIAADRILGGSSVGFVAFMMEVSEIETTMMLWSVFNVFFLNFLSLFASFKLGSNTYTRYH